MRPLSNILCYSLLIGLFFLVANSHAANIRWGTGNGFFHTPASWTGGVVPGALDVAQFGRSFIFPPSQLNYTVSFNNNATNQALHIEDDLVTFDLNSRLYTVTAANGILIGNQLGSFSGRLTVLDGAISVTTNIDVGAAATTGGTLVVGAGGLVTGAADLVVGKFGTGILTLQEGGDLTTGTTTIGAGAPGTATVTGGDSEWSNTGELIVGSGGTGTLNISAGARVENTVGRIGFAAGQSGSVTVDGIDSKWVNSGELFVGDLGTGTLTIIDGRVESAAGSVGAAPGASGVVTISGAETFWRIEPFSASSNNFVLGASGDGTVKLNAGVVLASFGGIVGRFGGSIGRMEISDSNSGWDYRSSGILEVGSDGTGELYIAGGGGLFGGDGIIGTHSEGIGSVSVSGPDSSWRSVPTGFGDLSSITVGSTGEGTLNIADGGFVSSGVGIVDEFAGGSGTVTVDGADSRWLAQGWIVIGAVGDGTLLLTNGGRVEAPEIFAAGELSGDGVIVGKLVNSSLVSPGTSAGVLRIEGEFKAAETASLKIELGGTERGTQYDALDVTLDATLGGTLNVTLINGFTPVAGHSFHLLDAASISGSFSTLNLPALADGLAWNTSQLHSTGTLYIGLLGDFDLDGDVDGRDFLVWQRNTSVGNLADWQANYGAVPPLSSSATAVPEPGCGAILLMFAGVLVGIRRKDHTS